MNVIRQNEQLVRIDDEARIQDAITAIQKRHLEISKIETPNKFIEKKMGLDYVKLPYMKRMADSYYPGWSWEIVKSTIHVDSEGIPTFIMVHGRLKWYENGLWRSGDMVAGHRIQRKSDDQKVLVDPGNDIKAGNTDCMKKAMNVFMNISDDVYKADDPELNDEQKEQIMALAKQLGDEDEKKFEKFINDGSISKRNMKGVIAKLDRQITEKREKKNDTI